MSELKFKPVPYDIVTSASTGRITVRGTDANAPYNSNLLNRLQAVADSATDSNLFDDNVDFGELDLNKLQELLTQVAIRFDNDPNYYTKRDYQYLIWYLCKSLKYLENNDVTREEFDKLKQVFSELENNVVFKRQFEILEKSVNSLSEDVKTLKDDNIKIKEEIKQLLENQQVLEAGDSIKIEDNKISAVLDEPITPNVTIGGIEKGELLEEGVSLTDIIKQLLIKVVDYISFTKPSITLGGLESYVEFGMPYSDNLTIKLNKGIYHSADTSILPDTGQDYQWDFTIPSIESTHGYVVIEQPTELNDEYSLHANFEFVSEPVTITVTAGAADAGDLKNSAQEQSKCERYDGSDIKNSITVSPYYPIYIGQIDVKDFIDDLTQVLTELSDGGRTQLHQESYIKHGQNSVTCLNKAYTTDFGWSPIVLCPIGYVLSKVLDTKTGWELTKQFELVGTVTKKYDSGNDLEYNVYINPVSVEEIGRAHV